jgi:hypothetical protein
MSEKGFTRGHFFYGTLLAGVVPTGGFGGTPSLKMLGYKSPNEKLNIASIGAGGKAASDIRGCAATGNTSSRSSARTGRSISPTNSRNLPGQARSPIRVRLSR